MRIYFDVSCLNRPFDDQGQTRIRLETEAVIAILALCQDGSHQYVSSMMAVDEVEAISEPRRRSRVRRLLPEHGTIMELTPTEFDRALELTLMGFKPADAVHIAAAETLAADVLLSCDDRLCRTAKRNWDSIRVRVENRLNWLKEMEDAAHT